MNKINGLRKVGFLFLGETVSKSKSEITGQSLYSGIRGVFKGRNLYIDGLPVDINECLIPISGSISSKNSEKTIISKIKQMDFLIVVKKNEIAEKEINDFSENIKLEVDSFKDKLVLERIPKDEGLAKMYFRYLGCEEELQAFYFDGWTILIDDENRVFDKDSLFIHIVSELIYPDLKYITTDNQIYQIVTDRNSIENYKHYISKSNIDKFKHKDYPDKLRSLKHLLFLVSSSNNEIYMYSDKKYLDKDVLKSYKAEFERNESRIKRLIAEKEALERNSKRIKDMILPLEELIDEN